MLSHAPEVVPLLARVWQMLLKGIEEAGRAPNPVAATESAVADVGHHEVV